MKTETLHLLVETFEEERCYLESFASAVSEDSEIAQCRQRAGKIASLVSRIRVEITARAQAGQRKLGEAQRFDIFLQSALAAHLDLTPANGGMREQQTA